MLNSRKNLTLKNNTKFFDKDSSKGHNTFSSSNSYAFRKMKIEGYETRTYWQYRYCDTHDGQTFYYTLTYNNAALPKKYGKNCFDYEDLRDLLTGGFRKQLLRKYGTTFKYFIGAELGDGKGTRGMANNPHYHILFFLEPANNDRYPYIKISPEDFRTLVKEYWQGFDENKTGYRDYNEAKYGIAKEGENCGLVIDFRAETYVAKYVCKDVQLVQKERDIRQLVTWQLKRTMYTDAEYCQWFYENILLKMYSEEDIREKLLPHDFDIYDDVLCLVHTLCSMYGFWKLYRECHVNKYTQDKVDLALAEWRNRYCNKARCSQGVGLYGLKFIADKLNPTIQVPSKQGFKNRPLPMYYYRKLYMDVVKDKFGKNHYVLNELGQAYKVYQLPKKIEKMQAKAVSYIDLLQKTPDLYTKMRNSDVNNDVFYTKNEFFRILNYLLEENNNNKDEITKRYAEYKLIYEDRFFKGPSDGSCDGYDFPVINPVDDFRRFIQPTIFKVAYSDTRATRFFENGCKGYLAYMQHPYFLRYVSLFNVLDLCADYLFCQKDAKDQQQAQEIAAVKRFHDQQKLKDFYSAFTIFSK